MKKIIVILIIAFASNVILAQTGDKNPAATRKEKRNAEIEKQYELNKTMLGNRDFVLEADRLQDRRGHLVNVSSNINFVAVDSATAIIQVGSNYRFGSNGVGGVTAKGTITKWKLTENKKHKSFDLYINVMTPIGIYDLFFTIGPSNTVSARLTGLSAGELTFNGRLVPYTESAVYEGQSL
jgi:hypothetical protein